MSGPTNVYLVTAVTFDRRPYFGNLRHGRTLVNNIRAQDVAGRTDTIAYVVMPDHFHWLFTLVTDTSLAAIVKRVKGSSARNINALSGGAGPVWQPSFHDHAVRREESLVAMAQYVVMNPVRAGLVQHSGDYSLWDCVWDMSAGL